MKTTLRLAVFTALTLVVAACGGDVSDAPLATPASTTQKEIELSITAGKITLQKGEKVTLRVSVSTSSSRLYTLAFASSTPSVATVSADGALDALAAGTTTVTATATLLDTNATSSATVTIVVTDPTVPVTPPTTPPAVTWSRCAAEAAPAPGDTCTFQGRREVRYGVPGAYTVKVAEGAVTCSDGAFGVTVPTAYQNFCEVSSVTTTAPVTAGSGSAPTPPANPPATPPSTQGVGPRVATFTASGPIVATAGQVISGVRISNPNGPCITINVPNVTVRDSDLGPCGSSGNIVVSGATGTVIEFNSLHDGKRGVLIDHGTSITVRNNTLTTFAGGSYGEGSALEFDYVNGGVIDANRVRGSNYRSDAVSAFESSNLQLTHNDIDVNITEPSSAGFTMGDMVPGAGHDPGHDNYVAFNVVRQTGGVPAGVFGSSGNTILEKNCLTAGIQAYNYSGVFTGVTVRQNVINLGASFVPDSSVLAGWGTNIDSTDCSRVP